MLISSFCRATGLSRDTVRFYVRQGLLNPKANGKGGRNPYRSFTDEDILAATVIRVSQSLGMSLKEIAVVTKERRTGGITRKRRLEILGAQLVQLEAKAAEMTSLANYLRAKIAWVAAGEAGAPPDFRDYLEKKVRPRETTGKKGSGVLRVPV
jgi:MerR family copper efflux transcriptional regulator